MSSATENPLVTHDEFMEIFWFCDTETPEELEAIQGMSDEEIDEKSPIVRRLAILSKIHEALFGVPTKGCKIVDPPPRSKGRKGGRPQKKVA